MSESLVQFSHTIAAQTSLDTEGHHLTIFNKNYEKWNDVFFPKPLIPTDSVLVESFEQGQPVAKFIDNFPPEAADFSLLEREMELSRESKDEYRNKIITEIRTAHMVVTRGEDLYLKMLLQDNLMHADLHPGNILLQRKGAYDPVSGGSNEFDKIVMVDAGMVAELDRNEQRNFIGLIESLGEGDGNEATDYVLNFSSNGAAGYSPQKQAEFRADMVELFSRICRGYGHNVSIGEVLRGVLNLVRKHSITVEANYATLVMNALCLESMALAVLPAYNVLDGAKSLLKFNRVCKKFGGLATWCQQTFLPFGQWVKKRTDIKFLRELEKKVLGKMV